MGPKLSNCSPTNNNIQNLTSFEVGKIASGNHFLILNYYIIY